MKLTKSDIESFRTERGAFTGRQMELFAAILGEPMMPNNWTLAAGWPERLIGKEIDLNVHKEILDAARIRAKEARRNAIGQLGLL